MKERVCMSFDADDLTLLECALAYYTVAERNDEKVRSMLHAVIYAEIEMQEEE